MSKRGKPMSAKDRARRMRVLYLAQGGLCAHCGGRMPDPDVAREHRGGGAPRPRDPTIDHVVPRARHGRNSLANLLLAHRQCNDARGAGRLPVHAEQMRKRVLGWLEQNYGRVPQSEYPA